MGIEANFCAEGWSKSGRLRGKNFHISFHDLKILEEKDSRPRHTLENYATIGMSRTAQNRKTPEKNIGSNHILILGEENFLIPLIIEVMLYNIFIESLVGFL